MASITVDLSDAVVRSRRAVDVLTLAAELMRNRGAVLVVVARGADGRSLVVTGTEGGSRLDSVLLPAGEAPRRAWPERCRARVSGRASRCWSRAG